LKLGIPAYKLRLAYLVSIPYADFPKLAMVHLQVAVRGEYLSLIGGCERLPVVHVLVVVQVITPLNQVINLEVELLWFHLLVLQIVKGILVQVFELLLESNRLESRRVDILTLLQDYLRVLCVFIQLPQPFNFLVSFLLRCLLLANSA
jgi:hypothetical protein